MVGKSDLEAMSSCHEQPAVQPAAQPAMQPAVQPRHYLATARGFLARQPAVQAAAQLAAQSAVQPAAQPAALRCAFAIQLRDRRAAPQLA